MASDPSLERAIRLAKKNAERSLKEDAGMVERRPVKKEPPRRVRLIIDTSPDTREEEFEPNEFLFNRGLKRMPKLT